MESRIKLPKVILQRIRFDPTVILVLGFCGFIGILLSTAVIISANKVVDIDEYAPLYDPVPEKVNLSGPIKQGGEIQVTFIRCNKLDIDVIVTGVIYFQNEDTNQVVLVGTSTEGVRNPGCNTATTPYKLPMSVMPGKWRLKGVDRANEGNQRQSVSWYSDLFVVTPEGT